MHVGSISIATPVRSAVMMGGRFSSSCLTPFAYRQAQVQAPFYQHALAQTQTQTQQQARLASTYITRVKTMNNTSSSPISFICCTLTQMHSSPRMSLSFRSRNVGNSIRKNSTVSQSQSPSPSPEQIAETEKRKLDWESFFKLRRIRRRYTLAFSVIGGFVAVSVGGRILSEQDIETFAFMGWDPIVGMILAVLGLGAVGWLIGPIFGNSIFGFFYRRYTPSIAAVCFFHFLGFSSRFLLKSNDFTNYSPIYYIQKEKDLYGRIKRFRGDPSSNTVSNPVPDYYGEKINSIHGYRTWLKDQRVYNRKREANFV